MRNWDSRDEAGGGHCTADEDYEDAQRVCKHLGAFFCSLSLTFVVVWIYTICKWAVDLAYGKGVLYGY